MLAENRCFMAKSYHSESLAVQADLEPKHLGPKPDSFHHSTLITQYSVLSTPLYPFPFTLFPCSAPLNFWKPSSQLGFKVLQWGEPFLFKLHAPRNFIVGGGFFTKFLRLPVSLAWETFGEANGARSLDEVRIRIAKYRKQPIGPTEDPVMAAFSSRSRFSLKSAIGFQFLQTSPWAESKWAKAMTWKAARVSRCGEKLRSVSTGQ